MLAPDRWQRAKDLFHEAAQWPPEERAVRLEKACAGDNSLQVEVASLLKWADDDASFLDHGTDPNATRGSETLALDSPLLDSDVGPYRIERQIGRGGMGRVFLAKDHRLNRKVAVKVLDERVEGDRSLGLREARAIARFSHPNIASIHDVVEQAGRAYIVMEFLEGETLAARLRRGPLPIEDVLQLSVQMAMGLGHAHKHSIVHCDFKPANVFITTDGVVKLLDFGLARHLQAETGDESEHVGASPTLIRQRAGTPAYMSPEHLNGQPLDPRSDVYSFGLVLHEMATLRRPPLSLRLTTEMPSDAEHLLDPALPPPLRPIVARALSANPEYRFQSAGDVEAALRAVTIHRQWPFTAASPRFLKAAAALLVLSVLGAAAFWSLRSKPDTVTVAPRLPRAVVAVMPLGTGADVTEQYLAAGLTEIVTNDLATSPDLVVISNSSRRSAGDAARSPEETARALGATHVVVGSLKSDGTKLSIEMRVFSAVSKTYSTPAKLEATYADVVGRQRTMAESIRARLIEAGLPVSREPQASTSATADPLALEEYARGREYLDRFDVGENLGIALKLFDSALQRDPGFALLHAAKSEAEWRTYRITLDSMWAERAQASAFEAMRLAPNEPSVRYSAALVLRGTGRTREAMEEAVRLVTRQPNNDDAHRLLAQLYLEANDIDKAVTEFQAAIELRPGWWENYHQLGLAYYGKNRYKDAIAAFTRETELRPDSATPFQALGTAYHAMGDVAHALENYERAIAIAPSALSYSNIGLIHYANGRFQEAVAAYEQSSKIAPRAPATYRNLGDSLVKTGDAERARASYRRAIALAGDELRVNPRLARMIALQAVCYAKLRERSNAMRAIDLALATTPADSGVLFQAAAALAVLGEADRAIVVLKDAAAKGYSRESMASEEELATLRQRPDFKALIADAQVKQ